MRAVVVGLGRSGLAVVRYLHAQGLEVAVSEYRQAEELAVEEQELLDRFQVQLESGGHSGSFFRNADLVVSSPGIPADLPVLVTARRQGIPVVGELALAAGKFSVPVIGVTGSNGKTTVTSLIGHLLRTAGKKVFVGGNIGTPLMEYLLEPADVEVVVLELSSFQLESAGKFRPDIGLLLNLSADHLDRHGSMEQYAAAKQQLFTWQQPGDIAILGMDDPLVMEAVPKKGTVLQFGRQTGGQAVIRGQEVLVQPGFGSDGAVEHYSLAATRLASAVNLYNGAAAILAVRSLGCSQEAVRNGLVDYEPPEHRMTPLGTINGVAFINDSKATNVGAVVAALAGFGKEVVLIAGGRDKGSDFSALCPAMTAHVRHLLLIGEAAGDLAAVLDKVVEVEFAHSMKDAVEQAFLAAEPGNTVLLAPACASFDMFVNYEERGRVFSESVAELASRTAQDDLNRTERER
jgi:UDP-N-acetylmuramoylalanine--D-glutamate ligase